MIPASTATCCSSRPCATPTRCAALHLPRAERGKPILAYKLGRSEAARELAVSHTGALAGEDDVADAFLADCGIARVDHARRPDRGPAAAHARAGVAPCATAADVGVVTTTGGGATMVVDPLSTRGRRGRRSRAPRRWRASRPRGIDVKPARIVDVTLAGARYDIMKAALDILTHRAGIRSDRCR